jgi:hypothetical protein
MESPLITRLSNRVENIDAAYCGRRFYAKRVRGGFKWNLSRVSELLRNEIGYRVYFPI